MKLCPNCRSFYTDNSLEFCLECGTGLFKESTQAQISHSTSAETLIDGKISASQFLRQTTANHSQNTAQIAKAKQTKTIIYSILSAILVVGIGAIIWNFAFKPASSTNNQQIASTKPSPVSALSPEKTEAIKKEISEFLTIWKTSLEKCRLDENQMLYVKKVEVYYDRSGVDNNEVRADRQRACERYETLQIELNKLEVAPETDETTTAIFDKTWFFKGKEKTSSGSVQQEMRIVKQNGKWQITGEKDAQLYYINNRKNDDANANQANAPN